MHHSRQTITKCLLEPTSTSESHKQVGSQQTHLKRLTAKRKRASRGSGPEARPPKVLRRAPLARSLLVSQRGTCSAGQATHTGGIFVSFAVRFAFRYGCHHTMEQAVLFVFALGGACMPKSVCGCNAQLPKPPQKPKDMCQKLQWHTMQLHTVHTCKAQPPHPKVDRHR
jgi:hypothetical protein